jgi:hypothetical protein
MALQRTVVTRQQLVNSNRGTMFSVRSVLRCYKQDRLVRSASRVDSHTVSQLHQVLIGFTNLNETCFEHSCF